jgi:hypothetical protein
VLIPYFTLADGRYFLILASPKGSNASLGLHFFDTSGILRSDKVVSLSTDDTQVIEITSSVSPVVSEGSILITGLLHGSVSQKAPIIARGLWVDSAGTTRVIDPAIGRAAGVGGDRWSPLDSASAYIWAPRDDGIEGEARVLFSCPVGHLAFRMDQVGPPFPNPQDSIFIVATIFDTSGNLLGKEVLECQGVGVRPSGSAGPFLVFPRLKDLSPLWAGLTAAGGTYTEFRSFAVLHVPKPVGALHMGYLDVRLTPSGCTTSGSCSMTGPFFGRLHPARAIDIFVDK